MRKPFRRSHRLLVIALLLLAACTAVRSPTTPPTAAPTATPTTGPEVPSPSLDATRMMAGRPGRQPSATPSPAPSPVQLARLRAHLADALQALPVASVVFSGQPYPAPIYGRFLEAVGASGARFAEVGRGTQVYGTEVRGTIAVATGGYAYGIRATRLGATLGRVWKPAGRAPMPGARPGIGSPSSVTAAWEPPRLVCEQALGQGAWMRPRPHQGPSLPGPAWRLATDHAGMKEDGHALPQLRYRAP